MRRKQTSIRFSRSVPTHRYLRSISWISWVRRLQAAALYKLGFHTEPQSAHTLFSRRCLYPRPAIAMPYLCLCFHLENRQISLRSFPEKKKNIFLPFPRTALTRRSFLVALPTIPRAFRQRPIAAGPSPAVHVVFCGLPINKKCGPAALRREPAQKSVDFSLKKNARRHAWLSRSCFGRNRRPAFATALFPFSFFTKEKKKENRSKFSRFEYIARTHFVRPHDVRD